MQKGPEGTKECRVRNKKSKKLFLLRKMFLPTGQI